MSHKPPQGRQPHLWGPVKMAVPGPLFRKQDTSAEWVPRKHTEMDTETLEVTGEGGVRPVNDKMQDCAGKPADQMQRRQV